MARQDELDRCMSSRTGSEEWLLSLPSFRSVQALKQPGWWGHSRNEHLVIQDIQQMLSRHNGHREASGCMKVCFSSPPASFYVLGPATMDYKLGCWETAIRCWICSTPMKYHGRISYCSLWVHGLSSDRCSHVRWKFMQWWTVHDMHVSWSTPLSPRFTSNPCFCLTFPLPDSSAGAAS